MAELYKVKEEKEKANEKLRKRKKQNEIYEKLEKDEFSNKSEAEKARLKAEGKSVFERRSFLKIQTCNCCGRKSVYFSKHKNKNAECLAFYGINKLTKLDLQKRQKNRIDL